MAEGVMWSEDYSQEVWQQPAAEQQDRAGQSSPEVRTDGQCSAGISGRSETAATPS